MLRWFNSNPSGATTGLHAGGQGLALASIRAERGRRPRLIEARMIDTAEDPESALRSLVGEAGLDRSPANLVLGSGSYQLLQVEAPNVAPSELRAAVRWKLRELIDFHIDDAVIDVFDIPGQENRPADQAMMYAVAARARDIREHIDRIEDSGLALKVIDITELAMRNLAALTEADTRGVAMLYLGRDQGNLTITRQGSLYLTRRLDTGWGQLEPGALNSGQRLVLEVQRSLDYYDRHFAQPPVSHVYLIPGFEHDAGLAETLASGLEPTVEALDWQALFDPETRPPGNALGPVLLAAGGALRQEGVSL